MNSFKLVTIVFVITVINSGLGSNDTWWHKPCISDINKIRHGRSTSNHIIIVKNQLRIFTVYLKISLRKIENLYTVVQPNARKVVRLLRLPKVKKNLIIMKKESSHVLEELYQTSQSFASALEYLRNIEIPTEVDFDRDRRSSIYQDIAYHLRLLLCEIRDSLRIGSRTARNSSLGPEKVLEKDLPVQQTDVHFLKNLSIQQADVIFFKKANRFFKKVKNLLKDHKVRRKVIVHKKA